MYSATSKSRAYLIQIPLLLYSIKWPQLFFFLYFFIHLQYIHQGKPMNICKKCNSMLFLNLNFDSAKLLTFIHKFY